MFDLLFLFTFSASTTFLFEFHFIWFRWFSPHSSSSSHFLLPTILFYVCFEYWLFIFMIFQHCVSFFSYFEILILLLFMYFLRDIFPFQLYIHDVCCEETVSCLSSCSTLYFGICSKCFDCLLKILPQWETKLGFYFLTGFHFVSIYFSVKGWGDYFWFCFHDLWGFAAKPNFFIWKHINTYMYVDISHVHLQCTFICTYIRS